MIDYPRFEVYRKAIGDKSNDTRIGESEDFPLFDTPFPYTGSPYPIPKRYDFDTLEAAKERMRESARLSDLMTTDYYILKVTEDGVEVAHGDPTTGPGGEER